MKRKVVSWSWLFLSGFVSLACAPKVSASPQAPAAAAPAASSGCRTWEPPSVPSLCPWKESTRLPEARTYHASVVAAGRVYVVGGYAVKGSSITYFDSVVSANAADLIGGRASWRAEKPIKGPRTGSAIASVGKCLFVVGGSSYDASGLKYYDDVQSAALQDDGTLTAWKKGASALLTPRSNHTLLSATVKGTTYLYAVAGVTEIEGDTVHLDTVEYAKVENDCTIAGWKMATFHIHGGRSTPQALSIGDRLAVLGGWGDLDLEDVFSDVQFAQVRESGVPTAWRRASSALPTGLYGHASLSMDIAGGHVLLVVGGQAGSGAYAHWVGAAYTDASLQRIGSWKILSNGQLPGGRSGLTAHLIGNDLIVIGGSSLNGKYYDEVLVSSVDAGAPDR